MSNKMVVVAIFKDEVSADAAAASLKDSGVAKGDAIGVLVLNEKGELKADKVGKRSWGKGTGIGAVVALVTPVGLAAGLIGGGLLGALHHKNLGLDEADRDRIGSELQGGQSGCRRASTRLRSHFRGRQAHRSGRYRGDPFCLRRGCRGSPDGRHNRRVLAGCRSC